MTERSALESIKSVIMDVPQMLKTISVSIERLHCSRDRRERCRQELSRNELCLGCCDCTTTED